MRYPVGSMARIGRLTEGGIGRHMDLSQAIEHANAMTFPGFLVGDEALTEERRKNEEAIKLLSDAWWQAPAGKEPFPYELVMSLADRNRTVCDSFGTERLRNTSGDQMLARSLSVDDLVSSIALMQGRPKSKVAKEAGPTGADLNMAYTSAPIRPITILGIDLETTERYPDRGYIINMGLEFMKLAPDATPHDAHVAYFGLPDMYEEKGVPLTEIHKITWADLDGKTPLRQDKQAQRALLKALSTFPFMAHNAAFEDSWLCLNIDGYAEARKRGKIRPIDSRDICRRVDPEYATLPHDSGPARLENWARRRGVLEASEKERHLGLEDVDLMFRTVVAEFKERHMFPEAAGAQAQDRKAAKK